MELKEGLLGFDTAIQLLKDGCKVTREKWVEQGKFIVYQKGYPKGIPCNKNTAEAWGMNEGELFICNPYLQIRNEDGSHSMYSPSSDDVLAEDWCLYLTDDELAFNGLI